jgi:hypothetical protein
VLCVKPLLSKVGHQALPEEGSKPGGGYRSAPSKQQCKADRAWGAHGTEGTLSLDAGQERLPGGGNN